MTDVGTLGRTAWRAFNTDGVPSSGEHNPYKPDIHAFVDAVEAQKASVVDTLAGLKGLTSRPGAVLVKGKTAPGDGWGGVFYWHANSTVTADDALAVQCTSGAPGRYRRYFDGVYNVVWFGAKNDLSQDSRPAIQAAIDAATLGPAFDGLLGGVVFFPPGFYAVNTASQPIKITKGIKILGSGMGGSDGFANSGGTVIRNTSAAGDLFVVEAADGCQFEDVAIDAIGVTKLGDTAAIRVHGAGGVGTVNFRTRLTNYRIIGFYDALVVDGAGHIQSVGHHIQDYTHVGVNMINTGNIDGGSDHLIGGTIQDLNVGTSLACVRYEKGGDFHLVGGKYIGGQHGFLMQLTDGPTGTVTIDGGYSFEEHSVYAIDIQQSVPGKNFANVVIGDGQFSQIEVNPAGTIRIGSGTGDPAEPASWVKLITMSGFVINNYHNQAVYAIDVQDGNGVVLDNIVLNGGNKANPKGINVAGNAESLGNVKIGQSISFIQMAGEHYSASTYKFIAPMAAPAFSSGSDTVAAGATAYLGLGVASALEKDARFYPTRKAKALRLRCAAADAPGVGESFTYTLRVGGVDTALTCTTTGSNTDSEDAVHLAPLPSPVGANTAARYSLKVVASGGAAVCTHRATVEFVGD
jgi:hypothetical protein